MKRMKIATVVGARPQFIKAAVVSRELRKKHEEILIHTGQHFDENMSDIFFREMNIPKPDYNLGIAGGTHGQMTGDMMIAIEKALLKEKPDALLVYGDTNSTIAAALAAVKLHIPVCHVEAGNRVGTLTNPEEVNRICTDHVSSLLMYCTESAEVFLQKEGLIDRAFLVGDPMYDAFLYYSEWLKKEHLEVVTDLFGKEVDLPREFYYMTCHREENTIHDERLIEILEAMNSLESPTIYPVHPRNREQVKRLCGQNLYNNIITTQPVGYLRSIDFVRRAKKVVTDSGGVQREAFFSRVQCVTVLDFVCWPETMVGKVNQLAKPDRKDIISKLSSKINWNHEYQPFGNGHSAVKIVKLIEDKVVKNF